MRRSLYLRIYKFVHIEKSRLYCERSVGTVFQLPILDAIYSQDENKESYPMVLVFAHGPRVVEAK
jgi:hypothetical protein